MNQCDIIQKFQKYFPMIECDRIKMKAQILTAIQYNVYQNKNGPEK